MDTRYPGHLSQTLATSLSRRSVLRGASMAGASVALLAAVRSHDVSVAAQREGPPEEWFAPDATVGGHGQVIIGEGPIYLSHLPMFMFENPRQPGSHPHHYQVILEVSVPDETLEAYLADRQATGAPLYTLEPTEAVPMRDIILPALSQSPVQTLNGNIIRGHWEREDDPQPFGIIWKRTQTDVPFAIERVVYAHEFSFAKQPIDWLEYLLFGAGDDLFLAHRISAPPDFDQLLPVTIESGTFSDDQLREGIVLAIPERANSLTERLRDGDGVTAEARHNGTGVILSSALPIEAGREIFFEEGELRFPLTNADFSPTDAEIDAGFP